MSGAEVSAGNTGYLHRRANADGSKGAYTWRGYDGSERSLDTYGGAPQGQYGYYAAGSDTVLTSPLYSSGQIQTQDMATGATTEVTLPAEQQLAAVRAQDDAPHSGSLLPADRLAG
ncbi:hypothetical protein [Streptomyces sp. NPDC058424]|uniref:hypothetical protein n=1 Tax=Streptomyces sp. NPDC058424 TaxID=3346491 RepID=UPI0036507B75